MIKNIIFDFGAVLVDWNPHYLYDKIFTDPVQCEQFIKVVCAKDWNAEMDGGKPFDQAIAERIALYPQWEEMLKIYKTRWVEMMSPDEIPGMRELMKELRERGYKLYGLTNWSDETFSQVEDRYEVFKLLDGKVVSGRVKMLKPNAEIYHCLLDKYGLKAGECVFIDDVPANVQGAVNVGIHGIVFESAQQLRTELEKLL